MRITNNDAAAEKKLQRTSALFAKIPPSRLFASEELDQLPKEISEIAAAGGARCPQRAGVRDN
jgi:hypothetical protein